MTRRPTALLAALLTLPLWVAAVSGAVEVRACVPVGSPLLGAELLLLRPDSACASGQALGDGALVVVGTICLVTLGAGLASLAALAGLGSVLARLAGLISRLVDAVTPWRRAPRGLFSISSRLRRALASSRVVPVLERVLDAAVPRRGPPALA